MSLFVLVFADFSFSTFPSRNGGPLGVAGEALVVRQQTNDPAPEMRLAQEVRYGLAALGVEVSGRLVGEQHGMYSKHHLAFLSGVLSCERGWAS
jgi:hypothetical protein